MKSFLVNRVHRRDAKAAERATMKNHSAAETAAAKAHNKQL